MERIESLEFRPQGTTWPALLARLEALGFRAAVVGADGSGKTTFLEQLARRLPVLGVRPRSLAFRPALGSGAIRADIATARDTGPSDLWLIDGADHLSVLDWWRLKRALRPARGVVIASHRHGLLPTLLETRTSVELLETLVRDLAPEHAESLLPLLGEILARHSGNVRTALLELFDVAARASR